MLVRAKRAWNKIMEVCLGASEDLLCRSLKEAVVYFFFCSFQASAETYHVSLLYEGCMQLAAMKCLLTQVCLLAAFMTLFLLPSCCSM